LSPAATMTASPESTTSGAMRSSGPSRPLAKAAMIAINAGVKAKTKTKVRAKGSTGLRFDLGARSRADEATRSSTSQAIRGPGVSNTSARHSHIPGDNRPAAATFSSIPRVRANVHC
jgi:hypothetical protein